MTPNLPQNAIDTYNETDLEDPDYLVDKYYTDEQFALILSIKFGSIALYLGSRVYSAYQIYKQYKAYQQFRRVTNGVATRARANAVSSSSFYYILIYLIHNLYLI